MSVSADVLYLPMVNPVRLPLRLPNQTPYPAKMQAEAQQHRIYRLPSDGGQEGLIYGPGGYAASAHDNGRLIDLYA